VLVEGPSEEHDLVMMGRHRGQAPDIDGQVYLSGGEVLPGQMRRVRVTQASDYDLVGDLGFSRVVELEWWQNSQLGNVEITHTPSRHWGARVVRDIHRGYGGYVLRAGKHSVYHAGDTAYFDGFKEIGERLNPELALLPIGAYHPASFRNVHTSPEDAIQAFQDLGARWMVPMHYGTFRLSYEPVEEPVQRLLADAEQRGIGKKIRVLEEGVTQFFE